MPRTVLITGSSGLVGSEAVRYFDARGWRVTGMDNNTRRDLFGADGDTRLNLERLRQTTRNFSNAAIDIRDRAAVMGLVRSNRPDLVIHCAAQPSHDLAARRPFDDFDINAVGTLNLLEAVRSICRESPFIFTSTNKVYGDSPNRLPLLERSTRFEHVDGEAWPGIDETCGVDASLHSVFGASKLAADVMVQEYGRYFGMQTVCLRAGCLTGAAHAAAELHGFLAYLCRAAVEQRTYRVYGYRGKQVRDNLHAHDMCTFFELFHQSPKSAAVYNIGGGRPNSTSILEAIDVLQNRFGRSINTEYIEQPRTGDHICYISDCRRLQADYPEWRVTVSLDRILMELLDAGLRAA